MNHILHNDIIIYIESSDIVASAHVNAYWVELFNKTQKEVRYISINKKIDNLKHIYCFPIENNNIIWDQPYNILYPKISLDEEMKKYCEQIVSLSIFL